MLKTNIKKTIITIISLGILTACDNSINKTSQSEYVNNKTTITKKTDNTIKVKNIQDAKEFFIKKYGLPDTLDIKYLPDLKFYQVYVRGDIIYLSQNGEFLISGHIISTINNTDITQKYIDEKNVIDVKKLPLNLAIKEVKGNGKNIIYVFSDPDCPYCHIFNNVFVENLNDVTVYNFLTPLTGIHPNAESDSLRILCSKNPSETLNKWLNIKPSDMDVLRNKILPPLNNCPEAENTLVNLKKLEQDLNISGTPSIYNKNGKSLKMTTPIDFQIQIESSI